uniref:Lipid droplet-associated hydrolase n=1 Tax=Heterorhabditis bacteriophora TaxID=37862 RepID=A0A1I7X4D5_HETBA
MFATVSFQYLNRFQLDAQVQHKLDFVREYLPKGQKVYIFGHSIGSYMMLRYLQDTINEKVNKPWKNNGIQVTTVLMRGF